jgi:hypothetical protein
MSLQQIKRDLEEIKDSITPKISRFDLSNAKAEFMAKHNKMRNNMKESGETCVISEEETEELIKKLKERAEEGAKNPYFQRYIRGF